MNQRVIERNSRTHAGGEGTADVVFDDVLLLQRLADGWPVWRLAQFYGTSVEEVRQAIGPAVANCAGEDAVLFGSAAATLH